MAHAIRIHQHGGPEVLRWEEVTVADPGPGEVRVRNTAIGLNFIDTYQRSGLYPMPLPFTCGSEGAGVVEAIGPKVKGLKVGDRVAYANPIGAYAEVLLRPADKLVKIPAGVSDQTAAAMMLKGMTAWYLLRRTYKVKKGDTILVHAAAGGVGLAVAFGLYLLRRHMLLQLAMLGTLMLTIMPGYERLGFQTQLVWSGTTLLVIGATWFVLGWRKVLEPGRGARIVGPIIALMGPTTIYDGSDARAWALLLGVVLAIAIVGLSIAFTQPELTFIEIGRAHV